MTVDLIKYIWCYFAWSGLSEFILVRSALRQELDP